MIEIPSKVTAEPSVRPRKLVGGSCPTEFWQSLGPASKRWADFGMTQVFCAAWKPEKRHCILLHVSNRKTVLHLPGNGDDSGV